jgi:predicted HAD superfamily Cof-like phosphohydrolase
MKEQIKLVRDFHEKFGIERSDSPCSVDEAIANRRYRFMREEVDEYLEGAKEQDLPNVAKELADILFTVYGTIVAHGLEGKIEAVFAEVAKSNMTKEFHPDKVRKGKEYVEADINKFFKKCD